MDARNDKLIRMTTQPVTIEVVPSGQAPDPRQQQSPRQPQGGVQYDDPMSKDASQDVKAGDLMVRIELNKPRVYEQQAVVCTIKLYTKYEISNFIATLQPSFDGFLIEEIPMKPSLNKVETLGGQRYMVAVLKRCILYPQKSGQLTITSGNYDVTAIQYEKYRTIFGTMGQPVERQLKVSSNSQTVNVLPLPEPKPATFTGAVGTFDVTTSVTPAKLKTFQTATYTFNITGTGNIKYIKAPEVAMPQQMDVYDPATSVTVNPDAGDMSGTVKIDYPFIPQFEGTFEIPAQDFTFFNPETGQYQTVRIPARKLVVGKGEGTTSNHYRLRHMDVRGLQKGDLGVTKKPHTQWIASWVYWLGYLLPLAALIATMIVYRKRLRLYADVDRLRHKRASKVATKRLKQARLHAQRNDQNGFYAELLTALWGYLSDKLTIPMSDLSKDNIQAELETYGVDEQLRTQVIDLLDKCEMAQYAPELADHDMNAVLDEASATIDNLENVKRKNN